MSAHILDTMVELAEAAGAIALRHFSREAPADFKSKGHLDLVTQADTEVEAFLRGEIERRFPLDGILGEEGSAVNRGSHRTWVIDPIDGTFNFVRGLDDWAVSIGIFENGAPAAGVIHSPASGRTLAGAPDRPVVLNGRLLPARPAFSRARGLVALGFSTDTPFSRQIEVLRRIDERQISYRFCGSTTIAFLMLAQGHVDANIGFGARSWDVMSGLPIAARLGAESSVDWARTDLDQPIDFVCGAREVVEMFTPIVAARSGHTAARRGVA